MSWGKYIVAVIFTIFFSSIVMLADLPIDNNVVWLGFCILGNAFILYQEN